MCASLEAPGVDWSTRTLDRTPVPWKFVAERSENFEDCCLLGRQRRWASVSNLISPLIDGNSTDMQCDRGVFLRMDSLQRTG